MPPVQAVLLNATLDMHESTDEQPKEIQAAPSVAASPSESPPPLNNMAPVPPAAPMVAVAEPSPAIAFSVPTKNVDTVVAHAQAVPVTPTTSAPKSQPAPVKRLTYGRGEGAQPAPIYPRESVVAQQQGTILVRFAVDEEGRVTSADVATPCPFPLLNQAAVRAVRESWRFKSGPLRTYEVAIQFQLK